jgi:hypothetical protein
MWKISFDKYAWDIMQLYSTDEPSFWSICNHNCGCGRRWIRGHIMYIWLKWWHTWSNQWDGYGMNRTEPTEHDFSFYSTHNLSVWLSRFIKIKTICKHKKNVWHLNYSTYNDTEECSCDLPSPSKNCITHHQALATVATKSINTRCDYIWHC